MYINHILENWSDCAKYVNLSTFYDFFKLAQVGSASMHNYWSIYGAIWDAEL